MEEQVKKGHGLGREDTHDSQKVEMQLCATGDDHHQEMWLELVRWLAQEAVNQGCGRQV